MPRLFTLPAAEVQIGKGTSQRKGKSCSSGSPSPSPSPSPPMEAENSGGWDFLDWLGPDTSASVFYLLDDPADLARAAAVSRSWRRFVIANAFCKSLCLRICPMVATFTRAVEVSESPSVRVAQSSHDAEAESNHRIYSYLGGSLVSSKPSAHCRLHCIGASSTDRFPDERIENTLDPREMVRHRPSYWSSWGQEDPDVPESLTYWLHCRLFIVDEIRIRPYQDSRKYIWFCVLMLLLHKKLGLPSRLLIL